MLAVIATVVTAVVVVPVIVTAAMAAPVSIVLAVRAAPDAATPGRAMPTPTAEPARAMHAVNFDDAGLNASGLRAKTRKRGSG